MCKIIYQEIKLKFANIGNLDALKTKHLSGSNPCGGQKVYGSILF